MKKEIFIALENLKDEGQISVYGTHLAKQLDLYAYLFSVIKVPVITPPVVVDGSINHNPVSLQIRNVEENANQKLEELVRELKEIHPQVYADTGVGFRESTVIDETKKKSSHIVVIGGNNELTTMREWFGTYETRLVENITVPALVVPKSCAWKPIRNIIYLMDTDSENVENMRFLIELSSSFGAKIFIVTETTEEEAAKNKIHQDAVQQLCDSLNYKDFSFHRVSSEETIKAIDELMIKTEADWLAFEHKDRSLLERIFGDYNTKHLVLNSEKPVLVF